MADEEFLRDTEPTEVSVPDEQLLADFLGSFTETGPDSFATNFAQYELLRRGVDLGENHWAAETDELDLDDRFLMAVHTLARAVNPDDGTETNAADLLADAIRIFTRNSPVLAEEITIQFDSKMLAEMKIEAESMSGNELVSTILTQISSGWDKYSHIYMEALERRFFDEAPHRWSDEKLLPAMSNSLRVSHSLVCAEEAMGVDLGGSEVIEALTQSALATLWEMLLMDGTFKEEDLDIIRAQILREIDAIFSEDSRNGLRASKMLDRAARGVYWKAFARSTEVTITEDQQAKIAYVGMRASRLIKGDASPRVQRYLRRQRLARQLTPA